MTIDWKHPLVVLAVTSLVSGLGFGGKKLYDYITDRSYLRVAIEHPQQAVQMVGTGQAKIDGQPVFCDTAVLTLLLEHSRSGHLPITVDGIAVSAEPIADTATAQAMSPICKVDPFGDRPYGIEKTNVYVIGIDKVGLSARYIAGTKEDAAWSVSKDNLLIGGGHAQSISLNTKDPRTTFTIFLSSRIPKPYKIVFEVSYDANGAQKKVTQPVIITGEQP